MNMVLERLLRRSLLIFSLTTVSKNGLLPVVLSEEQVDILFKECVKPTKAID